MMRQLPHTDVKYCMAFSFVEDISFWTFASHQSDCHWPELEKKAQDFTSSLHLLSLMAGRVKSFYTQCFHTSRIFKSLDAYLK